MPLRLIVRVDPDAPVAPVPLPVGVSKRKPLAAAARSTRPRRGIGQPKPVPATRYRIAVLIRCRSSAKAHEVAAHPARCSARQRRNSSRRRSLPDCPTACHAPRLSSAGRGPRPLLVSSLRPRTSTTAVISFAPVPFRCSRTRNLNSHTAAGEVSSGALSLHAAVPETAFAEIKRTFATTSDARIRSSSEDSPLYAGGAEATGGADEDVDAAGRGMSSPVSIASFPPQANSVPKEMSMRM